MSNIEENFENDLFVQFEEITDGLTKVKSQINNLQQHLKNL
jgi:hypothetical protein